MTEAGAGTEAGATLLCSECFPTSVVAGTIGNLALLVDEATGVFTLIPADGHADEVLHVFETAPRRDPISSSEAEEILNERSERGAALVAASNAWADEADKFMREFPRMELRGTHGFVENLIACGYDPEEDGYAEYWLYSACGAVVETYQRTTRLPLLLIVEKDETGFTGSPQVVYAEPSKNPLQSSFPRGFTPEELIRKRTNEGWVVRWEYERRVEWTFRTQFRGLYLGESSSLGMVLPTFSYYQGDDGYTIIKMIEEATGKPVPVLYLYEYNPNNLTHAVLRSDATDYVFEPDLVQEAYS